MLVSIRIENHTYQADLSKPLDISIPLIGGSRNVNAFYVPPIKYEAFRSGNFIGDVNQGGSCNVFSISFNPHGNGTHTETVGHISSTKFPINKCLTQFFFPARLITIQPEIYDNDRIIKAEDLKRILKEKCPEALIIRTLPNTVDKLTAQYSGTNPPYMDEGAAIYLRDLNVKHLLLDLPSIDKEEDKGNLFAHHAFWNYPKTPRKDCTITELIFVPELIADGDYLLNLQIASFDIDASPSKPVLFALHES